LSVNGHGGFEMLAIRNLGPTSFEIEFTEAPDAALAKQAGSYIVETFTREPKAGYGQGAGVDRHALAVFSVTPVGDRKVRLEFAPGALSTGSVKRDGTKLVGIGYTVSFDLRALRSAKGEELFDTKAYYTLNQFGPGESPMPGCMAKGDAHYDPAANDPAPELCAVQSVGLAGSGRAGSGNAVVVQSIPGGVRLETAEAGPHRVRFFDLTGKEAISRTVTGGIHVFRGFPRPGLYVFRMDGPAGTTRRSVLVQ
jgi:hypothetical protein